MLSSPTALLGLARDVVFAVFVVLVVRVVVFEGWVGLLRRSVELLKHLPGVEMVIRAVLRREVHGFLKQLNHTSLEKEGKRGSDRWKTLPKKGADAI